MIEMQFILVHHHYKIYIDSLFNRTGKMGTFNSITIYQQIQYTYSVQRGVYITITTIVGIYTYNIHVPTK